MKNLCVKMVFAAVAFAGVASAAQAYWVVPSSCSNVWVQTGLYYGQGYWDRVCY